MGIVFDFYGIQKVSCSYSALPSLERGLFSSTSLEAIFTCQLRRWSSQANFRVQITEQFSFLSHSVSQYNCLLFLLGMSPARTQQEDFDVSIREVPVTEQRRPFIQKEDDQKLQQPGTFNLLYLFQMLNLTSPGTARANEAASVEAPNGTQQADWAKQHRHQTVLQQHLAFFDPNNDGIIWPLDTYYGFRRLGYSIFLSVLSMFIIHVNFSYPTLPGFLPDPFFRIYSERVHKDKHGSDSGTYDPEGRFVPQKFEDIFAKYASGDKQGITLREIFNYMKGQRLVMDPFGWGGAFFECKPISRCIKIGGLGLIVA